ncbi:hypothetical protein CR513_48130, partial [Mucuna pruriens]
MTAPALTPDCYHADTSIYNFFDTSLDDSVGVGGRSFGRPTSNSSETPPSPPSLVLVVVPSPSFQRHGRKYQKTGPLPESLRGPTLRLRMVPRVRQALGKDNSEDDISKDPFSWVDNEVKRAFSEYTQGSLLLGLIKKFLRPGPWRVRLLHCQPDESVNNRASSEDSPFFYVYEPVFSKLGLKLPLTAFEQTILRALNVAPTQLHPNSWAFVRAFELLCEDLGQAPSLGVFFWFFRVKKTPKVGWMSLSSRPNRKLLKPFLESFKIFKNKFFKVCPGKFGPSLMFDSSGVPLFPFYWTSQPAVSITVVRKDLEKWEDVFISKLETLPCLFCSELIRGSGRPLLSPC